MISIIDISFDFFRLLNVYYFEVSLYDYLNNNTICCHKHIFFTYTFFAKGEWYRVLHQPERDLGNR